MLAILHSSFFYNLVTSCLIFFNLATSLKTKLEHVQWFPPIPRTWKYVRKHVPIDLCSFTHLQITAAIDILIVVSFFFFLSLARWVSAKAIQAGIIGQIAVGIVYGVPLANILESHWQQTFVTLGYVGLILIIFEGE